MEKIINICKESQLCDWQIIEKTQISHQAFFIGQKLDQHRISDVKHTMLTVYVDEDNLRGKASKEIFPSESDDEIRKDIEDLKFNASLAMEPYFELVKETNYFEEKKDIDLLASYKNIIEAVQNVANTQSEKINSYEVFVNQNYYHIVNSRSLDISYNSVDEMVEIVINSVKDGHEIEIYHMIEAGGDQTVESIRNEILSVFNKAKDRSNAVACPKLMNAHVLISGSDLRDFFEYFLDKTDTRAVYVGTSQVKIGDVIQKGNDCDKITLEVKANLPKSSKNAPYSKEGVKTKDYKVVDKGVYAAYNGDVATSYYLGIKDVAPAYNFVIEGASKTLAEMKREPYLEIIQFSSFQVDDMTGDFGGEFRLAYYFDGEKTIPVTFGSVTCNMNNVLNHFYMSKETQQINNCIVPASIELFDINVAGQD